MDTRASRPLVIIIALALGLSVLGVVSASRFGQASAVPTDEEAFFPARALDDAGRTAPAARERHRPAPASNRISDGPAVWWWGEAAGQATLVRHPSRMSVRWTSDVEALADKAMTLWLVVFNHPEHCTTGPGVPACTDGDIFDDDGTLNADVGTDFLYVDGVRTVGGEIDLRGTIHRNGESGITGTGLGELICAIQHTGGEDCDAADITTPGLTDPRTAEVHLVLHNHGQALEGEALANQTSTFLGGCAGLPAPFPTSRDDFQECQSIQISIHQADVTTRTHPPRRMPPID